MGTVSCQRRRRIHLIFVTRTSFTPTTKVVIVTEALRRIVAGSPERDSIQVTVVANAPGEQTNEYLKFSSVRLVTYR